MDGGLYCCQHAASHLEAGGAGCCHCGPAEVHGAHPGIAPAWYAPLPFRARSPWLSKLVVLLLLRTALVRSLPAGFQVPDSKPSCFFLSTFSRFGPYILPRLSRDLVFQISPGQLLKMLVEAPPALTLFKEPALFIYKCFCYLERIPLRWIV